MHGERTRVYWVERPINRPAEETMNLVKTALMGAALVKQAFDPYPYLGGAIGGAMGGAALGGLTAKDGDNPWKRALIGGLGGTLVGAGIGGGVVALKDGLRAKTVSSIPAIRANQRLVNAASTAGTRAGENVVKLEDTAGALKADLQNVKMPAPYSEPAEVVSQEALKRRAQEMEDKAYTTRMDLLLNKLYHKPQA
jgi:hypothetical protein